MAGDTNDTSPGLIAPIMPTGSGVADLEIAREQDALARDGALTGAIDDEVEAAAETVIPPEQAPMDDAAGGPQAKNGDAPVDAETADAIERQPPTGGVA